MSYAENLAYLKKIADRIEAVPLAIAKRTAQLTFIYLVENTKFDSGQAAANWRIEAYEGTPNYEPQKMMWGYGDVKPTAPVGYKSYYEGYIAGSGTGGETGDPERVLSWQMSQASVVIATAPSSVSGFTIYNPIAPGFAGFSPGDDTHYAENALLFSNSQLIGIAKEKMAQAEAEVLTALKSNSGEL